MSKSKKTRRVKVRPLKKVRVEIRGALVRDFDDRLTKVERALGRGRSVGAIGFTMQPYWDQED